MVIEDSFHALAARHHRFACRLRGTAQSGADGDWTGEEAVLPSRSCRPRGPICCGFCVSARRRRRRWSNFKSRWAGFKAAPYGERVRATSELLKMGPLIVRSWKTCSPRGSLIPRPMAACGTFWSISRPRRILRLSRRRPGCCSATSRRGACRCCWISCRTSPTNRFAKKCSGPSTSRLSRAREPAPLLVEALKDENPARRAAAAEAMVRIGGTADKKRTEPLLKDPQPLVRYQLGLALVEKHDKAGLPLLIQSIAEMPPDAVESALELLYRRRRRFPGGRLQRQGQRRRLHAAWSKWLDKHEGKLDLATQLAKSESATPSSPAPPSASKPI